MIKNYIVGFYAVPGQPGTVLVEAELSGHAPTDYRNLHMLVRKQFPDVNESQIKRTGSQIEMRDSNIDDWIIQTPGMTLRQIFPEVGEVGVEECFKNVGSVFAEGQPATVSLRYHYDRGTIGIVLVDRLTRQSTRYSNQLHASLLVENLATLIQEVLGNNSTGLTLKIHAPGVETVTAPLAKQDLKSLTKTPEQIAEIAENPKPYLDPRSIPGFQEMVEVTTPPPVKRGPGRPPKI